MRKAYFTLVYYFFGGLNSRLENIRARTAKKLGANRLLKKTDCVAVEDVKILGNSLYLNAYKRSCSGCVREGKNS